MSVGEITRLLEKDAKSFEKELQKAFTKDIESGFPKGELGPAAKNLSKVDMLRRLSVESKSQGRALTPSEIEALIKEVAAENKLKASKFNPKKPPIKETEPTPNEDDAWKKITDPNKNKWNWKKMLKWGAVAGVSAGALYYIYKKTHGEAPPPIVPPVPVPGGKCKPCSSFPMNIWCKSDKIREVQKCIGATADGCYGPKTEAKLKEKGYSTTITKDVYDKIIKNCGQSATDDGNTNFETDVITGTDV